jgi:hypothetical protein
MISIRTTARVLLVFALLGFGIGTAAASIAPPEKKPVKPKKPPRKQIVFPVLGEAEYTDDFGAPRPQGSHEGIDILAPRHAYALAAEAGRVKFYTGSGRAGCMLYLYGKSGTMYLYIHLNNDLTDGNDNRGGCKLGVTFPRGLKSGDRVAPGQLIGYVGDSGDANGIHPHLHFERHPHGGKATDPFRYLNAARRLLFYGQRDSTFTLSMVATVVATTEETMRVRVNTLRAHPGSLVLRRLNRPLTLTVPDYATVERGTEGQIATLASAKKGDRVSIWTEEATVTRGKQEGRPRSISAERIVLPATP